MENRKRKLLKLIDDGAPPSSLSPLRSPEEATASSSSELMTVGSPQASPPCDSSMALTIIVMLTALFFMAFFSILIRLFTDDSAPDISRRRPRYGDPRGVLSFSSRSAHYTASKRADPHAVRSLPVYSYGGMAKYQIDCCAICLNEFEDQEAVKVIPHCKHLFHVACIDTWLSSHVSCPVCRGTQLFDIKCGGLGALQERFDEGETAVHRGSTADVNDTCIEVWREAEVGVRRTRSCSSLGERGSLQRTSSF